MARSSTYIQNGRVLRSKPPPSVSIFWWGRFLLVALLLGLLIVTNPANGCAGWIPDQYWNIPPDSSWLNSLFRPVDTNYGLFSLTRTIDGISVTGLLSTMDLCEFDNDEDELMSLVCGWIDDTFCHGKPLLDKTDLPFTTNRIFCCLLVACMLFPVHNRDRFGLLRNSFASVLGEPTFWDLIRVNVIVYPALVNVDRLLRTYLVIDGYNWHFFLAFFILIFVIGAIGNQIGSSFQPNRVTGLGAAFAACLGYYRATGLRSTRSLFRFVDTPFTASTIFWLDAAMLLLQHQTGKLVAWIVGGMAGHVFGQIHRQWLAEALRSNASAAIHKTVQKLFNF